MSLSGPAGEYARVLDQVLDDASPHRALRPVRVPTAAAEVADRLVTAIALGEYLPGERLPSERDLAALLGVGRSTIREASGRLLAAGLVDVRRGRQGGIYVRQRWTADSAEAGRRRLPRRVARPGPFHHHERGGPGRAVPRLTARSVTAPRQRPLADRSRVSGRRAAHRRLRGARHR